MNAFESILKTLAASLEPLAAEALTAAEQAAILELNTAVQALVNKLPKPKSAN